jgi:hypothetical protein
MPHGSNPKAAVPAVGLQPPNHKQQHLRILIIIIKVTHVPKLPDEHAPAAAGCAADSQALTWLRERAQSIFQRGVILWKMTAPGLQINANSTPAMQCNAC